MNAAQKDLRIPKYLPPTKYLLYFNIVFAGRCLLKAYFHLLVL